MMEINDQGWAPIHDAAAKGYVRSLERYIDAAPEQIELDTQDEHHYTPIIIAAIYGHIDVIQALINAGVSLTSTTPNGAGIIELCIMNEKINVLEFFIQIENPKLLAWKKIIAFLQSVADEECELAGKCMCILTERELHVISAFANGAVPALVKVIKGSSDEEAKIPSVMLMNNMLEGPEEVKVQFNSSGGIPALVKLLKTENIALLQISSVVLRKLSQVSEYNELAVQNSAIQNLIKAMESVEDVGVLVDVVEALTSLCDGKHNHQIIACGTSGCVATIVGLYEDCTHKSLLLALTHLVSKLSTGIENNQNAFINDGITQAIIFLLRVKYKELQLAAVKAIFALAEKNSVASSAMIDEGVVVPLIHLLKKGRISELQEKCACALWALAGDHLQRRREMANMIGVEFLIEFLSSLQESLLYVGSEGLGVLAQGPESKQTQIGDSNGIHLLVRLLRSEKEEIVVSVIQTLRHLCVGIGYIPHKKNQSALLQAHGLKILVALMVHSRNELVQVEAAWSLGCAALGNSDSLVEIHKCADFSYVRILRLLFSPDTLVQLSAGGALAAFAYNSMSQQKAIADEGGVRFQHYIPFLKSTDEYSRCNTAFQIVVLSRIIPDEEQAVSSAVGIKLLVDLLQDSDNPEIQSLTCDCIARLAHTRAGVPAAIVSIGTVSVLCDLLYSQQANVRGCAAIALAYLTFNPTAQRDLLHRCRSDPYIMKAIKFYVHRGKMAESFLEGWKHSKKIGLPPIADGRPSLVSQKREMIDLIHRPQTIMSLTDLATSARLNTSPTMLHPDVSEEERSSRFTPTSALDLDTASGAHSQSSILNDVIVERNIVNTRTTKSPASSTCRN